MKKLKLFACLLALALFGALALTACGKPEVGSLSNAGNESFAGQISEKSYATADEAATAFLEKELNGSTTTAAFVSYEKTGDLSQDELAKLPLGDVKASDVAAAEVGKVTYRLQGMDGRKSDPEAEEQNRTQTVYLLGVDDSFRYFVPAARNGEMLTKSYFEDFWDNNHFLNGTSSVKIAMGIEFNDGTHEMKADLDVSLDLKVCETGAWLKTNVNLDASGEGAEQLGSMIGDGKYVNMESYFVEETVGGQKSLTVCSKVGDGEWNVSRNSLLADSLSDLFLQNTQPNFLDYTYFEKTEDGFALAPEKFELFVENYGNPLASMGAKAEGEANYQVKDKRLTKATLKMSANVSVEGATMAYRTSCVCDYFDYGKTVVTLPVEVQSLLNEGK